MMSMTSALAGVERRELDYPLDLIDLAGRARDAGCEVGLMARAAAGATSVAAIGRRFDIVWTPEGAAVEDAAGRVLDREAGSDHLAAAARLWRRFAEEHCDDAGDPRPAGTGLVAVGGFAFDTTRPPRDSWAGFPAVLLRVPALAVTRSCGRTYAAGDLSLLDLPGGWTAPPAQRFVTRPARPEARWLAAEAEAIRRLRAGDAEKVVMAREVVAHGDGVVRSGGVLRALHAAHPGCYTYLVSGADGAAFAGASPELLLRRIGSLASSEPMAGSTRRGGDRGEDDALARGLRACAKDGREHQVTARYVAAAMAGCSRRVQVGQPQVVRLANIQHLATRVLADLEEPAASLLDLAVALHPTPAVNGSPAPAARRLIEELEGMERGWYGGAVGWIDERGDGELAVAIRCGLLCGDGARLYAGSGTMPDSRPETELAETRLKLEALLCALRAAGGDGRGREPATGHPPLTFRCR